MQDYEDIFLKFNKYDDYVLVEDQIDIYHIEKQPTINKNLESSLKYYYLFYKKNIDVCLRIFSDVKVLGKEFKLNNINWDDLKNNDLFTVGDLKEDKISCLDIECLTKKLQNNYYSFKFQYCYRKVKDKSGNINYITEGSSTFFQLYLLEQQEGLMFMNSSFSSIKTIFNSIQEINFEELLENVIYKVEKTKTSIGNIYNIFETQKYFFLNNCSENMRFPIFWNNCNSLNNYLPFVNLESQIFGSNYIILNSLAINENKRDLTSLELDSAIKIDTGQFIIIGDSIIIQLSISNGNQCSIYKSMGKINCSNFSLVNEDTNYYYFEKYIKKEGRE